MKNYKSTPKSISGLSSTPSNSEEGEQPIKEESPLNPTASLLVKLGSIIVHYQEAISPAGHHFDKSALDGLLNDQEVRGWLESMDSLSLLPKRR